jgi:hypothetical protein
MTTLRWIADHWWQTWLLLSAAFVIGWTVYLAFFGESDEQRDLRRRNERAESARKRLRSNIALLASEEKIRLHRKSDSQVDSAVEEVLAENDQQTRAREAEGADDYEYRQASDGRRSA